MFSDLYFLKNKLRVVKVYFCNFSHSKYKYFGSTVNLTMNIMDMVSAFQILFQISRIIFFSKKMCYYAKRIKLFVVTGESTQETKF